MDRYGWWHADVAIAVFGGVTRNCDHRRGDEVRAYGLVDWGDEWERGIGVRREPRADARRIDYRGTSGSIDFMPDGEVGSSLRLVCTCRYSGKWFGVEVCGFRNQGLWVFETTEDILFTIWPG